MRVKLVDVKNEMQELEFGTCDLCMGSCDFDVDIITIEANMSNGEKKIFTFENFHYLYGDYDFVKVENYIELAAYLSSIEWKDCYIGLSWLEDRINELWTHKG